MVSADCIHEPSLKRIKAWDVQFWVKYMVSQNYLYLKKHFDIYNPNLILWMMIPHPNLI